jgi:hypothetical protein
LVTTLTVTMPFLALTITPSIAPSSAEETLPVNAAEVWALAGGDGMKSAKLKAAMAAEINRRMGICFPPEWIFDYSRFLRVMRFTV